VTYREVLDRHLGAKSGEDIGPERLAAGLEEAIAAVERLRVSEANSVDAQDPGHTLDEMITASGLSSEDFHQVYLSWVDVEATHFKLYKRAKHVLTEALRVLQFRTICLSSSPDIESLGALFTASQASCSTLFECSSPALDELTALASRSGALGSRLTGAGWGGCTVSLVPVEGVDSFIENLHKEYAPYKEFDKEQLKQVVFASKPGSGASVYVVKSE